MNVETLTMLVIALADRLTSVEQELRRTRTAGSLRPGDLHLLQALLPVIAALWGSEPFTIGEMIARPYASLRLVIAERSATSLGQAFARCAGYRIGDFVIERVGYEGTRALWRVVRQLDAG
jgi:hypothetical protein